MIIRPMPFEGKKIWEGGLTFLMTWALEVACGPATLAEVEVHISGPRRCPIPPSSCECHVFFSSISTKAISIRLLRVKMPVMHICKISMSDIFLLTNSVTQARNVLRNMLAIERITKPFDRRFKHKCMSTLVLSLARPLFSPHLRSLIAWWWILA